MVRVKVTPARQEKYLINFTWGASLTLTLILKKKLYQKSQEIAKKFEEVPKNIPKIHRKKTQKLLKIR